MYTITPSMIVFVIFLVPLLSTFVLARSVIDENDKPTHIGTTVDLPHIKILTKRDGSTQKSKHHKTTTTKGPNSTTTTSATTTTIAPSNSPKASSTTSSPSTQHPRSTTTAKADVASHTTSTTQNPSTTTKKQSVGSEVSSRSPAVTHQPSYVDEMSPFELERVKEVELDGIEHILAGLDSLLKVLRKTNGEILNKARASEFFQQYEKRMKPILIEGSRVDELLDYSNMKDDEGSSEDLEE